MTPSTPPAKTPTPNPPLPAAPPASAAKGLTDEQVSQFVSKGHLHLKGCIPAETVKEWAGKAYERLGWDAAQPGTWKEGGNTLPAANSQLVVALAPEAWAAITRLVGAGRIAGEDRHTWADCFTVAHSTEKAPEGALGGYDQLGWRLAGDDNPRHLDSAEIGLVAYAFWSTVASPRGGIYVACDSIGPVARYLQDYPEGARRSDMPVMGHLLKTCRDFVEVAGEAGDVLLLHPLALHAESRHPGERPRFMTSRVVDLREPMSFVRAKEADYSPVEKATLAALGVASLDYKRKAAPKKLSPGAPAAKSAKKGKAR